MGTDLDHGGNLTDDTAPAEPAKDSKITRSSLRHPIVIAAAMLSITGLLALIISIAVVYAHPNVRYVTTGAGASDGHWSLDNFKSLVTLGDSYTDEARGNYMGKNGMNPPVGWISPVSSNTTAVGGYVWPRWVNFYTGANSYNYAVGGAVCSTKLAPVDPTRKGIQEYELDAFLADKDAQTNGKPTLDLTQDKTVYAIWIGTNDLGPGGFVADSELAGKTIADFVECVFNAMDKLYAAGARRFVLLNEIPLNKAPMYATEADGGLKVDRYWPNKPSNLTMISNKMEQLIAGVNDIFKYKSAYEVRVSGRYNGAAMAVFDVHQLFTDMYNNPTAYFNGTAPANVTSSCLTYPDSTTSKFCDSPDSFLWWDELHPSQQSERMVAKEFVEVVKGTSKYATYWAS